MAVQGGTHRNQIPRLPERRLIRRDLLTISPLVSPGAQFGELPPSVQNTVRAETGSAEIFDILKETRQGEVIYRVFFVRNEIFPPLFIARDGSLLNPDLSVARLAPVYVSTATTISPYAKLKQSDLPTEVVQTLHQRASDTEAVSIDKETWGNQAVYIFVFRDEKRHPKLYIRADGTVLNDSPK